MSAEFLSYAAIAISVIAIVVLFITRGTAVTPANISAAITSIPSLATEVEKAATIVVNAYEQARRDNKLEATPELTQVMEEVRDWLPDEIEGAVTNEQLVAGINSAILLASAVSAQIKASKAVVSIAPAPSTPILPPKAY